jgi:hypothetical protein
MPVFSEHQHGGERWGRLPHQPCVVQIQLNVGLVPCEHAQTKLECSLLMAYTCNTKLHLVTRTQDSFRLLPGIRTQD